MKQTNQQIESLAYQKIKANDKLLQTLSELENVIEKLNDMKYNNCQADILIYKTSAGDDWEDFQEDLQNFIDTNETMLLKDSQENFETIKKLRK
jgi:hypothetical protein